MDLQMFPVGQFEDALPQLWEKSEGQRLRTDIREIVIATQPCGACGAAYDGSGCLDRLRRVRIDGGLDCWRPEGTVFVWEEEAI